jgi:coenzyme F420-0:L-glutamate ligase/coenzyme F420-1:gamma-L-glutamate ligase
LPKRETLPTKLFPIKLPTVKLGQTLDSITLRALQDHDFELRDRDVICVASKIVSVTERRIVQLKQTQISNRAHILADKYHMNIPLAQVVLDEADAVLGGVTGFLLTVRQGILTANAGVDLKNSPAGTAILWPVDPDRSAFLLRTSIKRSANVRIGVVIVDSRVTPLRLGTTGLAIGLSGFQPVRDYRGKYDIYNRRVKVTQTNVADDLASSAHLLMGERDERIGLVVVRNAPVAMAREWTGPKLAVSECLITSNLVRVAES